MSRMTKEKLVRPSDRLLAQRIDRKAEPNASGKNLPSNLEQKPRRGRPRGPTPGSYRDVEQRPGIAEATIRRT